MANFADDLETKADAVDAEARDSEKRAKKLREVARKLREQAASLRALEETAGLQLVADATNLGEMRAVRTGAGRPPKRHAGHPVHAADAPVAEIAKSIGMARSTLQDCMSGRRQMPADKARELEAKYGIPVSSWPRLRD